MKKILIIGGAGLLGNRLLHDLHKQFEISATIHKNSFRHPENVKILPINLNEKREIDDLIEKDNWHAVLHAASIGDVDYCERNKREAWRINVQATNIIAKACRKRGVKLVYFSTNAIYDGKNAPYDENSAASPLNFYGKTKLEGEKIIRECGLAHAILRLNTMYGWNAEGQRNNPAVWIIKSLRKRKTIKVVDDVFNSHLWVGFVSQVIEILFNKGFEAEILNVGGRDCLDRYHFARLIADVFDLDKDKILPAKSEDFSYLAPRPKNTCFKTEKIIKKLSLKLPFIRQGLKKMKDHEEKK